MDELSRDRRILVLGSTGQLGADLLALLQKQPLWISKGYSREDLDLCDSQKVATLLEQFQPDAVVNCTAYNKVDAAPSELDQAFGVNCTAVAALARICENRKVFFLHFSTDFVFDGHLKRPCREEDPVAPLNIYGLSKAAGENAIRLVNSNHCILRTCGVYGIRPGRSHYNFIEKILAQVPRGTPVKVRNDTWVSPTYAYDLANAALSVLKKKLQGTYHAANTGSCTWYEFTLQIFQEAGIRHPVEPLTGNFSNQSVVRPTYSALDSSALAKALGIPFRPWKEALAAYFKRRKETP